MYFVNVPHAIKSKLQKQHFAHVEYSRNTLIKYSKIPYYAHNSVEELLVGNHWFTLQSRPSPEDPDILV